MIILNASSSSSSSSSSHRISNALPLSEDRDQYDGGHKREVFNLEDNNSVKVIDLNDNDKNLEPKINAENENNSSHNYLESVSSSDDDQFEGHNNEIDNVPNSENRTSSTIRFGGYGYDTMKIAITVCGDDHIEQSLMTLKSAIVLTKNRLHFVIMADDHNMKVISKSILNQWPNSILQRISYEIHSVSFPNVENIQQWKKLFKLCAAQRLFLPSLLPNIDALLYIDTDVLFMTPVDEIWGFFHKMNDTQMAALSRESEDYASGWYNRFARHPFVPPLGVNSGVMLMNLTRMRTFGWNNYLEPLLMQYKLNIVWGDQDIVNIIFHYHLDKLYIFPCNWNYRPDHCIYTSVCKDAERYGVTILHGNRGVFINDKQPAFKAVYRTFKEYNFEGDITTKLLKRMKVLLEESRDTNCGKVRQCFTKALERVVKSLTITS